MLPPEWPYPHVRLMAMLENQRVWDRDLMAVPAAWLRIPTNATTHSNGSRPDIPIDRDQCGAGADSAVG